MSKPTRVGQLEEGLGRLLSLGTWAACALILAGLFWSYATTPALGGRLVALGTVILIALPVVRVIVMGVWFARCRDYPFALVAALVLLIILVSAIIGAHGASGR